MSESELPGYEVIAGLKNKGVGLFTTRSYQADEAIYPFDYWSSAATPMHATNHSCDPNATFDADGMLRALRVIAAHEEITYDYLLHPVPASPWNFACCCGAANCQGWVDAQRDQKIVTDPATLPLQA